MHAILLAFMMCTPCCTSFRTADVYGGTSELKTQLCATHTKASAHTLASAVQCMHQGTMHMKTSALHQCCTCGSTSGAYPHMHTQPRTFNNRVGKQWGSRWCISGNRMCSTPCSVWCFPEPHSTRTHRYTSVTGYQLRMHA